MRLIDANKIPYVNSENGFLEDYAYRYDINQIPTVDAIALPCKVGDEVWCIRDTKVYQKPVKGTVTEIYFRDNMDMCIVVRRLCRGRWGERVFATEQEAQAAIDRRMNSEKNL